MINKLNKIDIVKQQLFPTIMVPQASDLPPCKEGQTRLLMAADGLYIETCTTWGHLTQKLWDCPRNTPLPYGHIKEIDTFADVLHNHIIPCIKNTMITEAVEYAEKDKEWAGFIVWDGEKFIPWKEQFDAATTSVTFTTHTVYNLPEKYSLVGDIHSHGEIPPFFSLDDNKSDIGKIKISVVLGNYRKNQGTIEFDWKARYCVQGFFLEKKYIYKKR